MGSSPDLIYLWCELDPKKQMVLSWIWRQCFHSFITPITEKLY